MVTKKKTPEESKPEDVQQEEPYKPMAMPEPDPLERLTILEIKVKDLEKRVSQHNKYHFGGMSQG